MKTTCESSYGMFISLDADTIAWMKTTLAREPARKKVEVGVKFGGTIKEFTIAEFVERLGFTGEEKQCQREQVS